MNPTQLAATIVKRLEEAWNAGDGEAFGAPFTPDAHVRGRLTAPTGPLVGESEALASVVFGYTAEPASASQDAPKLLASWAATLDERDAPTLETMTDSTPPTASTARSGSRRQTASEQERDALTR
jgi:hypothetical protein